MRDAAVFACNLVGREGRYVSDNFARQLNTLTLGDAPWAENIVPLKDSKVALITTGGFFVKGQKPLREWRFQGDFAYRILPRDIALSRLAIGRMLLDHRLPMLDPNVLLPIDRLKELKDEGLIGEVAVNHYSFSGFCTDYEPLTAGSAKEVSRRLRYEGVDKVVVIAASILSQELAVLVQRAVEDDGVPTVSLLYTHEAAKKLKPPRAVVLPKPSLYRLEEYLDLSVQRRFILTLLEQFGAQKRGAVPLEFTG